VPSTVVWKAARLLTKSWEDGVVVYNLDSGNTHLLNPTAGEVLKYLVQSPAPASTLANQLAAENNLEADPELNYNIDRLLNYLDTLGLIEPLTQ
jgi:PqqD family protein of HPr-rel-A system